MVSLPRVRAASRRALTAVAAAGLVSAALASGPALLGSGPAYASSTPCGSTGTFNSSELTCSYTTPGADTFTVPANVDGFFVYLAGAQGGSVAGAGMSYEFQYDPGDGGWGAYASADFDAQPREVFQVDIGGTGGDANGGGAGAGGFGGGGSGGSAGYSGLLGSSGQGGAGGGGGSDIRAGSCAATLSCGPSAAIIVAAGGGGGGGDVGGGGGAGGVVQGGNGGNGAVSGGGNGSGGLGSAGPPGGSAGSGGGGQDGGGNGAAGTPGSRGAGGAGGSSGSGAFLGVSGGGGGGGGGGYFAGGGGGGGGGAGLFGDEGTGGGGAGGSSFIAPSAVASLGTYGGVQGGAEPNGSVIVSFIPSSTPILATPTLVTQASQDGRSIKDNATLSGGYDPTGTISFSLYGPGDTSCATPIATSSATVTGDGTYTSAPYTATAPGTYSWEASYGGDSNNASAEEGCGVPGETVTLNPPTPALSTRASLDGPTGTPVVSGQGIDDVATLSGGTAPTGTISFSLYAPGDTSCATPIATYSVTVNGNGTYTSPAYTTRPTGTYSWVASYSGDGVNDPVAPESCGLASETVTVAKAAPTLVSTASGGSPTLDSPISDSASLSGGSDPTGSITFALYANASCAGSPVLSSGAVPVSGDGTYSSGNRPAPDPATYYWVAAYSGDQNNNSVMTSCGAGPITVQIAPA
jgi:hypothetical protein